MTEFKTIIKKIRPGLIFFCGLLYLACTQKVETRAQLEWEEGRAVSVVWSGESKPTVYLAGSRSQEVLGRWEATSEGHRFIPLTGFSGGLTYYLVEANGDSTALDVPLADERLKPSVLAVYPTTDSLPSNLLKMYLKFSVPMQHAGHPLDHISVRDVTSDSLVHPFLRLETGLWNAEQTILTLWLDPGRIKTDLIPNRELGIPLVPGHRYRMELDGNLRSASGQAVEQTVLKEWTAGTPDRIKPDPYRWEIRVPDARTLAPLELHFGESLDAVLLAESFRLQGPDGQAVNGEWEIGSLETVMAFTPSTSWIKGEYTLQIQSLLEDMAGNNLNRLFDSDVQEAGHSAAVETVSLSFTLP